MDSGAGAYLADDSFVKILVYKENHFTAMNEITPLLWNVIAEQVSGEVQEWLKTRGAGRPIDIMTAFVAAPRHVPRRLVLTGPADSEALDKAVAGFSVNGWSLVRLVRVWLLTRLDSGNREEYTRNIRTLFDTAEMNELVALYSALPLLRYPETWLGTATDAVRSNIGLVLDAIALQNPYPAAYFPEGAWNQLVMKSVFNDKPVHLIYGLEKRANAELARILSDFAHERWAAGRRVAPRVWRLIAGFVNDRTIADLKHLLDSAREDDREAGALVCLESDFPPALELLELYPETMALAGDGKLNWKNLEYTDLNTYVS